MSVKLRFGAFQGCGWLRSLADSLISDMQQAILAQTYHMRMRSVLDGCVQPAMSPNINAATARVLDALDECRPVDQNRLIQWLKDFHNQTRSSTQKNWLKFLVTSRPYDDIQNNFKSITDSFPHIHLQGEQENDQIHKEIDLVVNIKVKELATISSLSTDVEQQLRYQLLQMEHRTYL